MTIAIVRDPNALMRHHVHVGSNTFSVDLGVAGGGEASGPNPHDLYDAALGACEALTILSYAKRKGIPVEDIQVFVERDSSEEKTGTYRLKTQLKLGGDLDEKQRQELLSVASRCPIRKLMTSVQTVIETSLIE